MPDYRGRLCSTDLVEGETYSGKRLNSGERKIIWIKDGNVCYSGNTLAAGATWPIIPVYKFLYWAKERKILL